MQTEVEQIITESIKKTIQIPSNLTENSIQALKKENDFNLRYDFGKKLLDNGSIRCRGLNIFLLIQELIRASGKMGEWSFAHHSHNGDFFQMAFAIFSEIPGLNKNDWPEGWIQIESLVADFTNAKNFGNSHLVLKTNQDLFNLIFNIQEQLIFQFKDFIFKNLKIASREFVKQADQEIQIYASSLDWFQQEWGRDTFITLPGLLLATGHFNEAKRIILKFTRYEKSGLIPNIIPSSQDQNGIEYNTVDAPLWYIYAIKKYLDYSKDWKFLKQIGPTVRNIIQAYQDGTGYNRLQQFCPIKMDTDGLIISPAQSTWMDADPCGKGNPVTPRYGKAVEVNALWYLSLKFYIELESRLGNTARIKSYEELSKKVQENFNKKFWNEKEDSLYDVIEGDLHGAALRPNMIFAISLSDDLLSYERQKKVFDVISNHLLTPFGLRTLSPKDPHYQSRYYTEKPPEEKDLAYHQGTVWPWLLGSYLDALVKVRKEEGKNKIEIQNETLKLLTPLTEFFLTNIQGSLPEVFDGNPPYRPGGTRSQAWSLAEILRIVSEVLQSSSFFEEKISVNAVVVNPGKPNSLHLTELPKPKITDFPYGRGVLVKSLRVGLDKTDKEINAGLAGNAPGDSDFLIIGHECVGQVVEVGPNVNEFEIGDYVVPTVARAGNSIYDQIGKYDLSLDETSYERGINFLHGYLTEMFVEGPEHLLKIPKELLEVGVLLASTSVIEKGIVQAYEIQRRLQMWKPRRAAVLGAGSIGLLTSLLLRLKGLEVCTLARSKAPTLNSSLIEQIGACYHSAKETTLAECSKEHGPFDLIFEATGNSSLALEAINHLGKNGVLILSNITDSGRKLQISENLMNAGFSLGNKVIVGSINANQEYFEMAIKDLCFAQFQWPTWLNKLLTDKVKGLENIQELIHILQEGKNTIKAVCEL